MTVLTNELRASYAFVERNFNLTKRYWGWEVAFMVYSVAGALAVTLIGKDQNSDALILSLLIGATFWNYLSVVFSIIGEQISWERWEGTLEYTMMAPVRRVSQLLGATMFAIIWGLIHTTVVLIALVLFFGIDLSHANFVSAGSADADRLAVDHRHRHDGRRPAAAVGGAWRSDGLRDQLAAAARQRRLLQRHHPAAVDAGHRRVLAGDLHPRRRSQGAHRRRADQRHAAGICSSWP